MMKITARKVAKDLGVSTATVSLAVNGRPGVNGETKKKILSYIKKLEEGQEGRNAAGKCIKMLTFIQSDFRYQSTIKDFTQREYAQICRLLQEEGMDLKLFYIYNKSEMEEIILESELDETAGILLALDEADSEIIENIPRGKVPIVIHDCALPYGGTKDEVINLHNEQGIHMGLDYLRSMGHKNIVYLYNEESIYNFNVRRRSFSGYMRDWQGYGPKENMIKIGGSAEERAEKTEAYFRQLKTLPDAVFTENFAVTSAVLNVLMKMGIKIPEDISVMGIDDPQMYYYTDVNFTCVQVPILERNIVTIRRMVEKMGEKEHYPTEILLGMTLKIGKTVKKI